MRSQQPHRGTSVRCDPDGCCRWIARSSVVDARTRVYESGRGPVPSGTVLEASCGDRRCVNLDHLRLVRRSATPARRGATTCRAGHELVAANVVRHRDGRIAYCRACRDRRRRERYRTDPAYARREIERQRELRRR